MSENNGLPVGWTEARISDISRPSGTRNPYTISRDDFLYVDIEALDNEAQPITTPRRLPVSEAPSRARMAIDPGDVIFSLVRPYLKNIAIVPKGLEGQIASTAYYVMRPEPGIESSYLFYAVIRDSFIDSVATYGNSPPSARDKEFTAMRIPVAPTHEQRRIVAAIEQQFTRLDAAVAALRRAQTALKRYRASILKDAVAGRLTASWRVAHPNVEPATALLARILTERRARWAADLRAKGKDPANARYDEPKAPDTTGLPELPDGWTWALVNQVVYRSEYGTSVKCTYDADGVPVLRIPNIAAGELDLNDIKYATVSLALDEDDPLRPGDILMCRTNGSVSLIGKAAVVRTDLGKPYTFASYLLRFRLIEAEMLPKWLQLYLSSPQGRRFIETNAASSAGQHNISLSLIHGMAFPLPPLTEQEQIVAEVEHRLSVVAEVEAVITANLTRAERLRQSILERAFSGRLVPQIPGEKLVIALVDRSAAGHAHGPRTRSRRGKRTKSKPMVEMGVEDMQESGVGGRLPLMQVLLEARTRLTPIELFRRAGYGEDEIDAFYRDLRELVPAKVRQVRPNDTDVFLEAVVDEAR